MTFYGILFFGGDDATVDVIFCEQPSYYFEQK